MPRLPMIVPLVRALLPLLGVMLVACGPYRTTMVGHEMRDTEFALQPEAFHLDKSIIGPVDVAVGRFAVPDDSPFESLGEAYFVMGIRFPFQSADTEAALTAGAEALATELQHVGRLRSRRRVDGVGFLGTELVVDGATPPQEGRALYVRFYVMPNAVFFLVSAASQRPAYSAAGKYLARRRERFFGAFRAVPQADLPPRELSRDQVQALTKQLAARI